MSWFDAPNPTKRCSVCAQEARDMDGGRCTRCDARICGTACLITHADYHRTVDPVDSETLPVSVLLQGDDINESYCGSCATPAEDWPRLASYHPCSRPGAIFQADLYCADCMPNSYNADGLEVRTFCGTRHDFTDGNGINCGCFTH